MKHLLTDYNNFINKYHDKKIANEVSTYLSESISVDEFRMYITGTINESIFSGGVSKLKKVFSSIIKAFLRKAAKATVKLLEKLLVFTEWITKLFSKKKMTSLFKSIMILCGFMIVVFNTLNVVQKGPIQNDTQNVDVENVVGVDDDKSSEEIAKYSEDDKVQSDSDVSETETETITPNSESKSKINAAIGLLKNYSQTQSGLSNDDLAITYETIDYLIDLRDGNLSESNVSSSVSTLASKTIKHIQNIVDQASDSNDIKYMEEVLSLVEDGENVLDVEMSKSKNQFKGRIYLKK